MAFRSCLVLLAILPSLAVASTISYDATAIPLTRTDWNGATTQYLSFQQFNPALGTLQSVELILNGGISTTLTATNTSLSSSTGHVNSHVKFTVQDAGGNLSVPQIDLLSADLPFTLSPLESVTMLTPITKSGSSDETYTQDAIRTEFTGGSTVSLLATTWSETLVAYTGGNALGEQVTDASLGGKVIYTFTPEPATLSLLALGGLLIARRRKA